MIYFASFHNDVDVGNLCYKWVRQKPSLPIDSTFRPFLDFIVEKQIPEEGDIRIGNSKF